MTDKHTVDHGIRNLNLFSENSIAHSEPVWEILKTLVTPTPACPNIPAFILLQLFVKVYNGTVERNISGIRIVWLRIKRPHLYKVNFKSGARTEELRILREHLTTLQVMELLKDWYTDLNKH